MCREKSHSKTREFGLLWSLVQNEPLEIFVQMGGGWECSVGSVANLEDRLEECSEEYKRTNGSNLTSTALLSTTHTHAIIKLPTVSLPSCMQQHR